MIDAFSFAGRVHEYLRSVCEANPCDQRARELKASAWRILAEQQPLVFAWSDFGYLHIGEADKPYLITDPGLQGLHDAWAIFFHGASVRHVLRAADLDGGPSGSALRNRLETAANWVERIAGCSGLAKAMRSPSVVIGRDGSIDYHPASHRPILLVR